MPDTVPPAPALTAEDRSGSPDSTILGRKPRKPRKAKATAPKVERKPREKPARTLRVRVAELGPTHLDAMDYIAKRDPAFPGDVRSAMDAADEVVHAETALRDAKAALFNAQKRMDDEEAYAKSYAHVLTRLNEAARALAHAMGEVPSEDEDPTFDGSGTPRDTAPPRHDDK